MVEAVARHGYSGTTVRELVALAGVSKSTFYEHFESKQDCFLATLDAIIEESARRVGSAYRRPEDFHEKMVAALSAFMELVVEEPAAASLAAVESLTLGSAGVAHRERSSETFELIARQSFDRSSSSHPVSEITVRAIINGLSGIVYRRLRSGRPDELPGLVESLVDWALTYQQPDSEAVKRAVAVAEQPSPEGTEQVVEGEKPSWDEPPDSALSRNALTQRERIVRAAARVVVERGYEALSIPAISAAAGTSNQTFYEHFASKREAFLEAFEILAAEALLNALAAFRAAGDDPGAIGAGLRALTEHIARNKMFARLAFFEIPAAGPTALDRADELLDTITSFLEPDLAPTGIGEPPPKAILEAIATGIWSVIQREIAQGRGDALPELAPELTRIALAPMSNG
ncbi:MAG TPA: TetR/AcrR family transcriptional regulator [Solirubrobacterales bacterium]|nr:TetR/AcrR family transcriptional regulator [Solirubrobacterales bacterium]